MIKKQVCLFFALYFLIVGYADNLPGNSAATTPPPANLPLPPIPNDSTNPLLQQWLELQYQHMLLQQQQLQIQQQQLQQQQLQQQQQQAADQQKKLEELRQQHIQELNKECNAAQWNTLNERQRFICQQIQHHIEFNLPISDSDLGIEKE